MMAQMDCSEISNLFFDFVLAVSPRRFRRGIVQRRVWRNVGAKPRYESRCSPNQRCGGAAIVGPQQVRCDHLMMRPDN